MKSCVFNYKMLPTETRKVEKKVTDDIVRNALQCVKNNTYFALPLNSI